MSQPPTAPRAFGVLLTVAYDGTPFSGYARQANARTVAGELDGAVRSVDPKASLVRGASRTDAGVHARRQAVAFDSLKDIQPRGWALALAQQLPDEISIVAVSSVDPEYDPRRHATHKTYRYLVLESVVRDPFLAHRAWRVAERLNHRAMAEEAATLVGEHDFRGFRGAADLRQHTIRTLSAVQVAPAPSDPRCLEITVRGNRFLYHMVRIIAGTLVDVGRGRLAPGAVQRAFASGDRSALGMTAPPEGLYLEDVELDEPGRDTWPNQFGRD